MKFSVQLEQVLPRPVRECRRRAPPRARTSPTGSRTRARRAAAARNTRSSCRLHALVAGPPPPPDEVGDRRPDSSRSPRTTNAPSGGRGVGTSAVLHQGLQLRASDNRRSPHPSVGDAAEVQIDPDDEPTSPTRPGSPVEQRFVALEQLLQRVQEQALAEASRTRQEIVLALRSRSCPRSSSSASRTAAEGLQADGQSASPWSDYPSPSGFPTKR